jgi:hypothetical protein
MQWVDLLWLVAPAFHPRRFYLHWMDLACLIGIGGVWLAVLLSYIKENSLLPLHDPRFVEAMEHVQGA